VVYVMNMERFTITKDQKITLYAAPVAFTLSFLIGILSGNQISVVVVRALVSSLLFSALLFGGLYLLRRYISEAGGGVTARSAAVHTEQVSGDAGHQVDYTISEHAGVPGTVEDMSFQQADESAGGESGSTGAGSGFPRREPEASRLSDVPGESELDELNLDASEGEGDQGEDDLPSLDRLFEEHEQEAMPEIKPSSSLGSKSRKVTGDRIKVGDASIPYEPEILAKAVKKVMKQDE
jgi:hypothetical protein